MGRLGESFTIYQIVFIHSFTHSSVRNIRGGQELAGMNYLSTDLFAYTLNVTWILSC